MAMKAFLKSFKYVPESEKNEEKPTTFYMVTLSRSDMIQFVSEMAQSMKLNIGDLREKDLDKIVPDLATEDNIKKMVEMYSELVLKSVKRIDNFYLGDKFYDTTESPEIIKNFIEYLPNLELLFEIGNKIFQINTPKRVEVKN